MAVLAVATPTLRAHSCRALVDVAAAGVEALRVASGQHFASARAWATAGGPGAIPAEVANAFPERSSLTRDEYSIQ
ncbi:MAG: hypothetical protein P8L45_04455 [Longimicrobiales bacterium]|nr:hypothetical protein [Longimicrobiales bacterium]